MYHFPLFFSSIFYEEQSNIIWEGTWFTEFNMPQFIRAAQRATLEFWVIIVLSKYHIFCAKIAL